MATVDKYKIVLDVQGEQEVVALTERISGLGAAIATIGIGAFIADAFRMADAMKDIADATGMTVGYVKAFSESLEQAGGSADDAGKVLTKFYQSIDDAAQGSDKAQKAFAKVGVTLDDLRNLSEQDLLKKTLDGLAKMPPGAERTAAAMDLLSKAFNTVDPTQLMAALDTKDVNAYNESFTKAADITQAFQTNINQLKAATVDVLTSIIGDINTFKISADSAREVVKVLAALIAGAFGASIVVGIMNVVKAYRALRVATQGAAIAQIALMAAGGPAGLAALAAGVLAAGAAYAYLDKKLAAVDANAQDTADSLAAAAGATVPGTTPPGGVGRNVEESDRVQKMKDQARAAAETTRQLRQQIEQIRTLRALDIALLDIDQDRAAAIRDYLNIAQNANNKIAALEAQIAAERAKGANVNNAVIAQLEEQIRLTQQMAAEQVKARQEAEKRLQTEKQISLAKDIAVQGQQLFNVTLANEEAINEDRIRALTIYGSKLEEFNSFAQLYQNSWGNINSLIAQASQYTFKPFTEGKDPAQIGQDVVTLNTALRQGLEEYADQLQQIRHSEEDNMISSKEGIEQRKKAINAFFEEYGFLIDENKRLEVASILGQIAFEDEAYRRRLEMLKQYQDAKAKLEQSSAEGAKAAFQQIADSTTPFQIAFDSVMSVFNNMNSALDTFVRTGKFKFKDFAMSIIRDLIMIQLRAAMAGIFKAISLAFLAGGGPATAGKPYIVGEKGPELFVPKASGTVIPNGQMVGGGNKGSGAMMNAPVTNNYITNNISAIDAKGVAQLFAENRKALLGSVRFAQKEQPYRIGTY